MKGNEKAGRKYRNDIDNRENEGEGGGEIEGERGRKKERGGGN